MGLFFYLAARSSPHTTGIYPPLCYNLSISFLIMTAANTPPRPTPQANMPSVRSGGSFATVEPPRSASVYDQPRPGYGYARSTYQPTAEQLARDEARRAYWRRNVKTPIIISAVLVVALLVVLALLAFIAPRLGLTTPAARSLIAGLAGLTVILLSIPLIALMSILPLAWLVLTYQRREQRKLNPETGPMAYRSRVQTLLWQLDHLLDTAERGVAQGGARVTRPLIGLHAHAGYWRAFAQAVRRNFTRSN